jgi:4-aminobutyrate aminotransferase-like enzyme
MLKKNHSWLGDLRGKGMLRGGAVNIPESGGVSTGSDAPKPGESADGPFMAALIETVRKSGLIVLRSGKNVLRLAPPLIMDKKRIDLGFSILDTVLAKIGRGQS